MPIVLNLDGSHAITVELVGDKCMVFTIATESNLGQGFTLEGDLAQLCRFFSAGSQVISELYKNLLSKHDGEIGKFQIPTRFIGPEAGILG
jgi:hypothetical protein